MANRKHTSLSLTPWTTKGGEHAEHVAVNDRRIGDVVAYQGAWEAWTQWPYGPKTDHRTRLDAIRHLRTLAAR